MIDKVLKEISGKCSRLLCVMVRPMIKGLGTPAGQDIITQQLDSMCQEIGEDDAEFQGKLVVSTRP